MNSPGTLATAVSGGVLGSGLVSQWLWNSLLPWYLSAAPNLPPPEMPLEVASPIAGGLLAVAVWAARRVPARRS